MRESNLQVCEQRVGKSACRSPGTQSQDTSSYETSGVVC